MTDDFGLDSFDYSDLSEEKQEVEDSSLTNENEQEEVEQEDSVEEVEQEIEDQEVEEIQEEQETATEETPKMVDIRALHESRENEKELKRQIAEQNQEIGKYKYISNKDDIPDEKVITKSVYDDIPDDEPVTAGESKAYHAEREALRNDELYRQMVENQVAEATKSMTEEVMGKGLDFKTIYGKLNTKELQLSPGNLKDLQDATVKGKDVAKIAYKMLIQNSQELTDLQETQKRQTAISKGKKKIKVGQKEVDKELNQTEILELGHYDKQIDKHVSDLSNELKF